MSGTKGKKGEKEVMDVGESCGMTPIRAPASGGGGQQRDLPDVLMGDGVGLILAIEAKRAKDGQIYLPPEEWEALKRFTEGFHPDTVAVITVRWDHDTTIYAAPLPEVDRTGSGKLSVTKTRSTEHWRTLEELIEDLQAAD